MAYNSRNWRRGKCVIETSGSFQISSLDYGEHHRETVTHPGYAFYWSDVIFDEVDGVRALAVAKTPTSFVVDVYRYASDEGPYYTGPSAVTIAWQRVGGDNRDPE